MCLCKWVEGDEAGYFHVAWLLGEGGKEFPAWRHLSLACACSKRADLYDMLH